MPIISQNTLFLVRGYPGSGRTAAIEALRSDCPHLAVVTTEPEGHGDGYENKDAQFEALKCANVEIANLARSGVSAIAVETCVARNCDANALIQSAVAAGYLVSEVLPAHEDRDDILACYARSTHEPSTFFYETLVQEWEPFALLDTPVADQAKGLQRQKVWKEYLGILRLGAEAKGRISALVGQYPAEAMSLGLDDGFTPVSTVRIREPQFPLAPISPYWQSVQASVRGIRPLPVPSGASPEVQGVDAADFLNQLVEAGR
jgi:hypothetical protein